MYALKGFCCTQQTCLFCGELQISALLCRLHDLTPPPPPPLLSTKGLLLDERQRLVYCIHRQVHSLICSVAPTDKTPGLWTTPT